jgi:fluoride exporter
MYFCVAIGGASGALLRFICVAYLEHVLGKDFPYGTAFVNIIGSLLIGIAFHSIQIMSLDNTIKLLIITGFLGGFTTFSSFSLDTVLLFENARYLKGVLNIFLNISTCIIMTFIGIYLTKFTLGK